MNVAYWQIPLKKSKTESSRFSARNVARKAAGPTVVPPNQTPWQQLARETVGQLTEGDAVEKAVPYQKVGCTIPRHNH